MKKSKNIEYYLWYSLIGALILLIAFVWTVSFKVPAVILQSPIDWILDNEPVLFAFYIISCALTFSLFLAVLFYSWYTIDFKEPFTFYGIFVIASVILLLSTFFVSPPPVSINTPHIPKTVYDTHPLIFYTTLGLIILSLCASISTNIKLHINEIRSRKN